MQDEENNGMKTIKMTIPERYEDTAGYLIVALEEIKKNPNHGYSDEDVVRIKKMEEDSLSRVNVDSESLRFIADVVKNGFAAFKSFTESISHPVIAKLQKASEKGWYVSPNVFSRIPMSELEELLSQSSLDEFEVMLMENSEKNVKNALKRCSESFPENKSVFNEIKQLIENGFYRASIIMAYSMADSMCNTKWGFGFFDRCNGKPKLYDKLEDMEKNISSLIKDQLGIKKNEITRNSKDASLKDHIKRKQSFNRHLIVHGHSLEYGTKKNAVRAVYLLDFIEYLSHLDKRNL
ncbi:MAG: hypothetical protein GQ574_24795 [Crocinitomix sp.]|nr:hypothetical protein [Crocinitomix sp.]